MEISEAAVAGSVVLYVAGRVNSATAPELGRRMLTLLDGGVFSLVVDLSRLIHITSAGFRVLLQADRQAGRTGVKLVLCGLDGLILELFDIGGFLEMFSIAPSREEAIRQATAQYKA